MKNIKKWIVVIMVMMLSNEYYYGQVSVPWNAPAAAGNFVGWTLPNPFPVDVLHGGNFPLNFYTNAGPGPFVWVNQKMQIKATVAIPTDGFVGIGNSNLLALPAPTPFGPLFPAHRLDVDLGDINVNQANNGYRIGGATPVVPSDFVLWHNGMPSNIYVGVNAAGGAATLCTGTNNTFVGNLAGASNTTGRRGTFIGSNAGLSNTSGDWNTMTGFACGNLNTTGENNCFYGKHCAPSNIIGSRNCYVGAHCASWSNGDENTGMGFEAGYNNLGQGNSYYGYHSSYWGSGTYNTYIGYGTQSTGIGGPSTNLTHTTTLGVNAGVTNNYQMILGDNDINVGIGLSLDPSLPAATQGPQNRLEINDASLGFTRETASNPTSGSSGLMFRQLNAHYTPLPLNPGLGVLAVDLLGNVVYVPDQLGFGYCSAPSLPQLADHAGIDLNLHNFYFDGMATDDGFGTTINAVGIGYSCTTPNAKLDIIRQGGNGSITDPIGLQVINTDAGMPLSAGIGINAESSGNNDNNRAIKLHAHNAIGNYGAWIEADLPSSPMSICYDMRMYAHDGYGNIGVWGNVWDGTNMNPTLNYGCEFNVGSNNNTASQNIGGKFRISGTNANTNYGVFGIVDNGLTGLGATNVGVYGLTPIACGGLPPFPNNNAFGSTSIAVYGDLGLGAQICPGAPNFAGYFNGDLVSTTAMYLVPSDSTLKHNIQPLTNPMDVINNLHPKSYEYNQQQNQSMILASGIHYGLLAQEVENILPTLVKGAVHPARIDTAGNQIYAAINYKAVNTIEIIPFLIAGMKQMDSTIHALQDQINNCCNAQQQAPPHNNDGGNNNGNGGSGNEKKLENGNIHAIELSNGSGSPIIYQNIPNPFSNGGTNIRYFVPDNTNNPQIVFFDEFGGKLSTFNILETGMGELDVTASNLSSGVYSYSLIINGKVIDTKKMIFQK